MSLRRILRGPEILSGSKDLFAVWLALVFLFAVSLAIAYHPLAETADFNLVVAFAMILLLASFLMNLTSASPFKRLIATAGLAWTSIMFALVFADYATRNF